MQRPWTRRGWRLQAARQRSEGSWGPDTSESEPGRPARLERLPRKLAPRRLHACGGQSCQPGWQLQWTSDSFRLLGSLLVQILILGIDYCLGALLLLRLKKPSLFKSDPPVIAQSPEKGCESHDSEDDPLDCVGQVISLVQSRLGHWERGVLIARLLCHYASIVLLNDLSRLCKTLC